MATRQAPKEDPLEKLGKLIDDRIKAAFDSRDQRETEAKDPWARIEGVIDRAVGRHFEAFAEGLEAEVTKGRRDGGGGGGGKGGDDEDEDDGTLKILGLRL